MESLSRGLSLFTAGTEEFAAFFDDSLPDGIIPGNGVLVKYQSFGLFLKAGITVLLLFFAVGSCYSPHVPLPLSIIITCGVSITLWCLFNSRFEKIYFFLDAERFIIKRWKYLIPG